MDNASVNETQPTPVNDPKENLQEEHFQETRPTPIQREEGGLVETRATPVMESPATGNEAPLPAQADQSSGDGEGSGPRRSLFSSWRGLALLGVLTLAIIAGMSALGGYRSGMFQRQAAGATQVARELTRQFELAMADMQEKRYDLARQRFAFIIQQDPEFPGVTDQLAVVLLELSITATPTLAPTPTLTPTPDLRSVEDLWTQAQQALGGGDWTAAIDTLLKLRKDAPDFHAVEVDGMLYVALMSRGVDKIKNADLEGGIYDLTLAERFGPLGVEARSYRSWAELYVTGASYWEIDWPKAIEVFAQLWQAAPYLRDASGWTSIDRYRIALEKYGDQLAQSGEWCLAQQQYQAALEVNPDGFPRATAVYAEEQCGGGGGRGDRTEEPPDEEASPEPPPEEQPTEAVPSDTPYP